MIDFQLDFEQQTEQPNGFWLSHWQLHRDESHLDSTVALPLNAVFEWNQTRFQLMSQQGNRLQFLAKAPISLPADTPFVFVKNHQAWWFLEEFSAPFNTEAPLLITASNHAIATALYLSQQLKSTFQIQVLLHSDADFPFIVKPAHFIWPGAPAEAIGAATLLEDWQIPNRLCHTPFRPGCYEGSLEGFLTEWQPEPNYQIIHCNSFLY
ncbi:hypothetical protein CYQ88_04400 [Hydrogenovibrio sp. SC-1]|uniref:hypothetical protein n=1 Tax=Hydrogenovibrio sp. SC-1 TaxID=2065820 RepID=UPI000C7C3760|nr:hypothetical protein [Hydrogenovibrio sp. SC-1]PLA74837.1 hypothetical protein CYQ88_04400 [Hydrogenovibrio sp. SC-1]